jgi:flagellar biosynthetic protein FliQ
LAKRGDGKMGFDANVEFLRMAFWQILIISGPLLAVALAIGLAIGILQAATSIQEMTLTFVPKLILVVVAFGLLANFMMVQLSDYFSFIFDQVAQSA